MTFRTALTAACLLAGIIGGSYIFGIGFTAGWIYGVVTCLILEKLV